MNPTPGPVLVIVDRSQREWDGNSYFVVDSSAQIEFQWFETKPDVRLLGRVIVVVLPPEINPHHLYRPSRGIGEELHRSFQ